MGAPSPRQRDPGFATFFSTIVSQQISTEAARAIMGRVNTLLPELHAKAVMEVEGQALRDAGLSWRKIEYAKGLAEAELAGTFSADGLAHLSDDEAITAITQLRGFGRWSAEIYLMFSLKRPDIFPADDLALRVALGRLKGMEDKPTPKQARQLVEPWPLAQRGVTVFMALLSRRAGLARLSQPVDDVGLYGGRASRGRCKPLPGRYLCHPWQRTLVLPCPQRPSSEGLEMSS